MFCVVRSPISNMQFVYISSIVVMYFIILCKVIIKKLGQIFEILVTVHE